MSFCQQCGAQLNEGVRFCQNCGAPVEGEAQSGQPAEHQPHQPHQPHEPHQPHQPLPPHQTHQPHQPHQAPPAWQQPAPHAGGWQAPPPQGTPSVSSGSKIALGVVAAAALGVGVWQISESGVLGGATDSGNSSVNGAAPSAAVWIVGRWAADPSGCNVSGNYAEFYADGRVTTGENDARWALEGDQLTVTEGPEPGTHTVRQAGGNGMTFDGNRLERCDAAAAAGAGAKPGVAIGGGAASQLERQLAAGVTNLRQQLPIVSGPLTLNRADQNGTEILIHGNFNVPVTEAEWGQLEQMMPAQQCPSMGHLIRQGATVTYRLTDANSEERDIRITSCP